MTPSVSTTACSDRTFWALPNEVAPMPQHTQFLHFLLHFYTCCRDEHELPHWNLMRWWSNRFLTLSNQEKVRMWWLLLQACYADMKTLLPELPYSKVVSNRGWILLCKTAYSGVPPPHTFKGFIALTIVTPMKSHTSLDKTLHTRNIHFMSPPQQSLLQLHVFQNISATNPSMNPTICSYYPELHS